MDEMTQPKLESMEIAGPSDVERGGRRKARTTGFIMHRQVLVLAALVGAGVARANPVDDVGQHIDALGAPIDFWRQDQTSALDDCIEPAGLFSRESVVRRLYVAGIMGGSFATLATPLGPDGNGHGDPSPSTNPCLPRAEPSVSPSKRSTEIVGSSSKAVPGTTS